MIQANYLREQILSKTSEIRDGAHFFKLKESNLVRVTIPQLLESTRISSGSSSIETSVLRLIQARLKISQFNLTQIFTQRVQI
ncbi:hypothetical protein A4A49_33316 [Nicotiana attenuata]|uniref:Uncharacterized protein n=1 Tax=Nicotiana attenuata TaxID=49451 RepID=A0A314KXW5_NICAT|nr:hypothetical protein A4A49_33316 [Nicotiana attenuata]